MSSTGISDELADGTQSNLTHSEWLMWLGQQLFEDAPLYNMCLAFEIRGELDADRLQQAFQQFVDDCDGMRTVFENRSGVPHQRVLESIEAPIQREDFTQQAAPVQAARRWLAARAQRMFRIDQKNFDSALISIAPDHHFWYLAQHHLTTDAWSMSEVFRGVSRRYLALEESQASPEPPPKFSAYRDFHRAQRDEKFFVQAAKHWRAQSQHAVGTMQLYGETARRTPRSRRLRCSLGKDRSQRIDALCQEPGVRSLSLHLSRFNLFAALWIAYLSRVSGEPDIAIGTPAHHRSRPEFHRMVGLFIELFPVTASLEQGETFRSLFEKVSGSSQNFLRYGVPGSSGAGAAQRSIAAILNYIPVSFGSFANRPTQTDWVHSEYGDAQHLIRLQVHDFSDQQEWQCLIDVNESILTDARAAQIPCNFLAVVDAMLDNLDNEIASVNLVDDQESDRLVHRFNERREAREVTTVVSLFEQQVEKHAADAAIVANDTAMTYRELDKRSNAIAKLLLCQGCQTGDRVLVCVPRSADLIASLLGVLKAGLAYVPFDPAFPAELKRFVANDTAARVALVKEADSELPDSVAQIQIGDVQSDDDAPIVSQVVHDNEAYTLYTSGSSGRPKGVRVSHRGLTEYVTWAATRYCDGRRLTFPLFSAITFDLTITSIFVPLVTGGKIRVYPEPEAGTADLTIVDVVRDDVVDIIKLTPAHLALLQDVPASKRLKQMILGGEDLKCAVANRVHSQFDGRLTIWNEYGPTEAVVGCMIHRYDPHRDIEGSVPIGRAASNRRIYLLDKGLNPVPQGVAAELYIGGAGLAIGYLNRPEEDERFSADPFVAGGRIYRSGDRARLNANGQIEFLGRVDDQVKVGGVRVELGEIENVLAGHPKIQNAAVRVVRVERYSKPTNVDYCRECGIASNVPEIRFDENGICNLCVEFQEYSQRVASYFRSPDELVPAIRRSAKGEFGERDADCIMLLSGGKDSTYALCQLVDRGIRPVALTLDNGYISSEAMENMRRTVESLDVPHVVLKTPAMNAIFVDSLQRHSNVCHGCFKAIYTLAFEYADEHGIQTIVTGLSRGQMFETRLTKELFMQSDFVPSRVDEFVLEARKAYHRVDDAVLQLLDTERFENDAVFDRIQVVDFYRYFDVPLDEVLSYLSRRVPWVRPSDTGRSTNCLINDAGIYVHRRMQGFHNYAVPYSWDVRMGHKQRDAALEELDDEINETEVKSILRDIGYSEIGVADEAPSRLAAYYVSGTRLTPTEVKSWLGERLASALMPSHFVQLEELPLSKHGKVDRNALPMPWQEASAAIDVEYVEPESGDEELLAKIWSDVLGVAPIGRHDNFFDVGGDSIAALRIVSQVREAGFDISAAQLFEQQTIASLSAVIRKSENRPEPPKSSQAFEQLDSQRLSQLGNLLKKKPQQ